MGQLVLRWLTIIVVTAALVSGCYLLPSTQQPDFQCHWEHPTNLLPEEATAPPHGVVRLVIGGDSRNDKCDVRRWACKQARERGANAFIFLGDMALTPEEDVDLNLAKLKCDGFPFYPIIGNHEVDQYGIARFRALEPLFGYNPEREFQKRFLGRVNSPAVSALKETTTYSVDLGGGVHFIALDNVGLKGFGEDQLKWLEQDLRTATANSETKYIIVGMHKALVNPCTTHSMHEDGSDAVADSDHALRLFHEYGVKLIVASHEHGYAQFLQDDGIPTYITGGLGAPTEHHGDVFFPHILQVDIDGSKMSVGVVAQRTSCRPSPFWLGD
jgi:Calcineurin-like phosphoesterase